jgi:hypothetical protein
VNAEAVLNLSLLALAGVMTLAAFAIYRTPAMAFFLEGFRFCG